MNLGFIQDHSRLFLASAVWSYLEKGNTVGRPLLEAGLNLSTCLSFLELDEIFSVKKI